MLMRPSRLGALALALGCATTLPAQDEYRFGACGLDPAGPHPVGPVRSLYVPMPDGVRIALDLVLPDDLAPGTRVPTVLQITRYWRGGDGDPPNAWQQMFASHGYATVWMDVRGTGASTGTWLRSRSKAETADYRAVAEWIAAQPWSDGRLVGWGISYGANTADFLAIEAGPRVPAVIPLFPDFDAYDDLLFPGGVFHLAFGKLWSEGVKQQDLNVPRPDPSGRPRGIRPVDGDSGRIWLSRAIQGRDTVPGIYQGYRVTTFKDDVPPGWDGPLAERSTHAHITELEASGAAMLVWASWLDAGTANGALHRFAGVRNRQRVVIGATSHGARFGADPLLPDDAPVSPSLEDQQREQLCFLREVLDGGSRPDSTRELIYYTLGEGRWRRTSVWPPAGSRLETWFLGPDRSLGRSRPGGGRAEDRYAVDFEATTGTRNRWYTQRGGGDVVYPDRREADQRLLTYTSEALARPVRITGTPVMTLYVSSSHTDGAFFAYLEAVAPDGRVTYLTEGQIRGSHRAVSSARPPHPRFSPYRTHFRNDAMPLEPGEVAELRFGLLPTSVRLERGYRLRIAIGGADRDSFDRIPAAGDPVLTVVRSERYPSRVELPIVE